MNSVSTTKHSQAHAASIRPVFSSARKPAAQSATQPASIARNSAISHPTTRQPQSVPQTRSLAISSNASPQASTQKALNRVSQASALGIKAPNSPVYSARSSSIQAKQPSFATRPATSLHSPTNPPSQKKPYKNSDLSLARPSTSMRNVSSPSIKPSNAVNSTNPQINRTLSSRQGRIDLTHVPEVPPKNTRASALRPGSSIQKINLPTHLPDINRTLSRASVPRSQTSMQKINTPTPRNVPSVLPSRTLTSRPGTSLQTGRTSIQRSMTSMNFATKRTSISNLQNSQTTPSLFNSNSLNNIQYDLAHNNPLLPNAANLNRSSNITPSLSRNKSSSLLTQNIGVLNTHRVNTPTSLNPAEINSIINKIRSTNLAQSHNTNNTFLTSSSPNLVNASQVNNSEIFIPKPNLLKARQIISELIKINSNSLSIPSFSSSMVSDPHNLSKNLHLNGEHDSPSNPSTLISEESFIPTTLSLKPGDEPTNNLTPRYDSNNSTYSMILLCELQKLLG